MNYKVIFVVHFIQNADKLKYVNFYKLYLPLTYNHVIGTEAKAGESDSHYIGFFIYRCSQVSSTYSAICMMHIDKMVWMVGTGNLLFGLSVSQFGPIF